VSRVITNNGTMIGYELAGADEATPIVFLHGVGSDKSAWAPQLKHFGKARRAAAFDYPGYGDSDPAPEGTTRDDYARAILSAMHELGIDRAHICGLSLGGVVAIAMAHHAPERCASLILADTFAAHPDGRAIYDRSSAASHDLRAMAEARADVLLAQPADPALRREVIETMARIDPAAYRIGAAAVWLADQRDRAAEIRLPTLVLCGAEDHITPPALSRELGALIPDARLELIDRAGHLSNMEQPEEFNTVVGGFIRGADDLREESLRL
jgi:3-oxoadipate enol-lactonase